MVINSRSSVDRRSLRTLPLYVLAAAALASLVHLMPVVVASLTTPEGWHFTGIHQSSPDLMQYRQWFRQTQIDGPIITNTFTAEPNRPHLLVLFAWVVGTIASSLGIAPEWVYAYSGVLLAVVFVVLLYRVVEATVPTPSHRPWIFCALFGGGFGGHLKLLLRFEPIRALPGVRASVYEPLTQWLLFEDYRGHFVFTSFYDSHFLLHWSLACASVLALLRQLQRPSTPRLAVVTALFALTTAVHVYTGITLVAVALGVALTCHIQKVAAPAARTACAAAVIAATVTVGVVALLLSGAGVPMSTWRAPLMLPSIIFISYPLALGFFFVGLPRLVQAPSLEECVLMGWAFGCLMVALSGPFYAYPDRGILSLQVPITILAGLVFFRDGRRPTILATAVALSVMAVTPAWSVARIAGTAAFNPEQPAKFQNDSHRRIIDAVRRSATRDSLLLADEPSLLWLAPEYPGRHYCGHFFLTVDYDRKQEDVARFYGTESPEARASFLRAHAVSLLFVPARLKPQSFDTIKELAVVESTDAGTLFSFGLPKTGTVP